MPRETVRRQAQPERRLLDGADLVHGAPPLLRDVPAFVEHQLRAAKQLEVVFDQPLRPLVTALLLVRRSQEDDVARQLHAVPLQRDHRHCLNDRRPLAVDRTATVEMIPVDRGDERRMFPLIRVGRHHVEVVQQHHRSPRTVSRKARVYDAAPRRGLEDARFDTLFLESVRQKPRGRHFVPRRVGRIDGDVFTKESRRLLSDTVPIDRDGAHRKEQRQGEECARYELRHEFSSHAPSSTGDDSCHRCHTTLNLISACSAGAHTLSVPLRVSWPSWPSVPVSPSRNQRVPSSFGDRSTRGASRQVIVHQTHRLHEGIGGGRTDEGPATRFEILAQRPPTSASGREFRPPADSSLRTARSRRRDSPSLRRARPHAGHC